MSFLARLFAGVEKPAAKPAAAAVVHAPAAAGLEPDHQNFVHRLNEALAEHSDVVSGKVHMIGLDEIKAMFGERWPKVSTTAHKVARQAIENRLTPADIYTPYGEANYMIVFSGLSSLEARMKCAMIARDISEKLLGTQGSEELLQVSTVVFKENGVLELKPVSDFDSLIQEFEARWAEQQIRQREAAIRWESPEDQERAWDALVKAMHYVYRPVLGVRSQMVAAYTCEPAVGRENGATAYSYGILPAEAPVRFLTRLDILVARKAAQDLALAEQEGVALMLTIPVHYETMARTRTRIAYTSEIQQIGENLRRKLLIELVGVGNGVPAGRLNEVTSAIALECRGVLLRLPPDYTQFEVIKASRVYACNLEIGADAASDAETFAHFDRFCEAVEHIGRRKGVRGLKTTSQLVAALGAGFEYVDGDVLGGEEEQLTGARPLDLAKVFQRQA